MVYSFRERSAAQGHRARALLLAALGPSVRSSHLQRDEGGLGLLVLARGRLCDGDVVLEDEVVGEVRLDRREVDEHVVELAQDEEARGHALPARDSVTLRGGGAQQLEVLLCNLRTQPDVAKAEPS